MEYKNTIITPKTDFPMKAGLPAREPGMLQRWQEMDLYHAMLEKNRDLPRFVVHDGPPFSNGYIHMGHALNKTLKDFIVRSHAMMGYYTPYVPGWDNHGLPIERAIENSKKKLNKDMTVPEFRKACEEFAQDFIDKQREGFKRLGVVADWDKPYRTMDKHFEAQEVKVFGRMFDKGYIYKGLKPVTWCPFCATAVAEADIEYQDDPCTSVYVKFPICDDLGKLDGFDKSKMFFVIWTTTIWTLPGNMGICLHPRDSYVLVKAENGETYIMAEALMEKTMKMGGFENYEVLASFPGQFFENMLAKHPFLDKTSRLVNAEYVTMDSGTGCVHTAPGFGADDYLTCMRYGMEMVVPVDDQGRHTDYAGKYAGMSTEESNPVILADMKESGVLFASEDIIHSYPHCWRCKSPIIFRATPQWFCSVDSFKDEAIRACEDVRWLPAWGKERMGAMIRERADWCISRQRRWGLPIPVFYCEDCKKPVCTDESIESVAAIFEEKGSNAWFEMEAAELLPQGFQCPHCGGVHFFKETDTLDGWFDSGSTHYAAMQRDQGFWPADMYLEGGDQYRGWFQSSLLVAVGALGKGAPYRECLTHGWTVDGEGRAMHKSLGNGVDPADIVKEFGADMVRLWAGSADYHVDVRCSKEIFKQLSQNYLKFRNTARYCLGNLDGFDPDHLVPAAELEEDLLRRVAQVGEQPLHLIQAELIGGSADADGGTHTAIQPQNGNCHAVVPVDALLHVGAVALEGRLFQLRQISLTVCDGGEGKSPGPRPLEHGRSLFRSGTQEHLAQCGTVGWSAHARVVIAPGALLPLGPAQIDHLRPVQDRQVHVLAQQQGQLLQIGHAQPPQRHGLEHHALHPQHLLPAQAVIAVLLENEPLLPHGGQETAGCGLVDPGALTDVLQAQPGRLLGENTQDLQGLCHTLVRAARLGRILWFQLFILPFISFFEIQFHILWLHYRI